MKRGWGGILPGKQHVTQFVTLYKEVSPSLSIFVNMSAQRSSRRLRGLPPEILHPTFRCFCLGEDVTCSSRAMQLHCCKQFLHRRCFERWRQDHTTCPLCRQANMEAPAPAPAPVPDLNLENLTYAEVIQRLERLTHPEELRREMTEVSNYFELIARTHWSNLWYRSFPVNTIIDVDIVHTALREDERNMLERYVHAAMGSSQYRINYIPQARSHRDPNYIHLVHLFDARFLRRYFIQDRLVTVQFISNLLFDRFNQEV